jgi:tetratricopeptide (TPR) repeat protein
MSHNFYTKPTILASLLLTLASASPINSSQAKARVEDTSSSWLSRTWNSWTKDYGQLNNLGAQYDKEGKFIKAFECFQLAAKSKNPITLMNLARCYSVGLGTEQNLEKAFACYVEAGHWPKAVERKATFYRFGIGTQKDLKKAFECYQELCSEAEFNENNKDSFFKFSFSAKEKAFRAEMLKELSYCYCVGQGVKQDHKKRSALLKLAYRYEQEAAAQQG